MWKWVFAAVVLLGGGYVGYDYYRGGFFSAPEIGEGDFLLSFKSGFRGVMQGIPDERFHRKYLAYSARDVPTWYQESWSICREPTEQEDASFTNGVDIGPGGRLDAVCEINADGDVFIRGWIASVPNL